jgi:hypothetical protein
MCRPSPSRRSYVAQQYHRYKVAERARLSAELKEAGFPFGIREPAVETLPTDVTACKIIGASIPVVILDDEAKFEN